MNHKILIIIGREYLTRVRKKSFLLLTILMPFVMAGLCAAPILLGMIKDSDQKSVVIIDHTHQYESLFKDTEQFHFEKATQMSDSYRQKSSDVLAVLVIARDLTVDPHAVTIYSRDEVQLDLRKEVEGILSEQLRKDKLASYNIPQLNDIIEDVEAGLELQTRKWTDDGQETESSYDMAMAIGFLFTFLSYMFVMSYGGMVMSSVTEEKTSRIMEVMVSSVSPFQLMMGKIIGVFFVGLTQMLIWGVMLGGIFMTVAYFLGGDIASAAATAQPALMEGAAAAQPVMVQPEAPLGDIMNMISALPLMEILLMFVLYFIGGYLLYASLFAAFGAAVDSQEDTSQFTLPVIFLMIFSLYAAMGSIENINGPLAFWTSIIPFTSPIVMMIRVPFNVPLWQELLSLGLLAATALIFVGMAARIYRVGILMYGKKPSIKEMLKWLRYK